MYVCFKDHSNLCKDFEEINNKIKQNISYLSELAFKNL